MNKGIFLIVPFAATLCACTGSHSCHAFKNPQACFNILKANESSIYGHLLGDGAKTFEQTSAYLCYHRKDSESCNRYIQYIIARNNGNSGGPDLQQLLANKGKNSFNNKTSNLKDYLSYSESDNRKQINIAETQYYMQKACSDGYADACLPLTYFSLAGEITNHNYPEKMCRFTYEDNAKFLTGIYGDHDTKAACDILQDSYRKGDSLLKKDYGKAYEINRSAFEYSIRNSVDTSYSACHLISMYYDKQSSPSIKKDIKNLFDSNNLKMPWRVCTRDGFVEYKLTKEEKLLKQESDKIIQEKMEEEDRKFKALPEEMTIDGKKCHKAYSGAQEFICE